MLGELLLFMLFFNTDDNNRTFNIMVVPFDLLPFRRRQNCGVMEQSPPSSRPMSAQDGSLAPEGEMFGSFFLVMLNYLCGDCLKTTMLLAGSCA